MALWDEIRKNIFDTEEMNYRDRPHYRKNGIWYQDHQVIGQRRIYTEWMIRELDDLVEAEEVNLKVPTRINKTLATRLYELAVKRVRE